MRTHLAGLVSPTVVSMTQPSDAAAGLTEEAWRKFLQEVVDLSDMFENLSHLELLHSCFVSRALTSKRFTDLCISEAVRTVYVQRSVQTSLS